MSNEFLDNDDRYTDDFPDEITDEDERGSRRRAAWGLTVLVLAAVVVIALIMIFGGTSKTPSTTVADVPGPATTSQPAPSAGSSAPPTTASSGGAASTPATSSTSAAPSTSASSSAAPGSKHCPSAAPCIIPGDDGGALDAANALRRQHGLPAVPGSVTPNAQQCAIDQGSGPSCVPHFAWQPLSSQDGAACVAAISPSWMLDPTIKTLSVGWALIGGQWQCAFLKAP